MIGIPPREKPRIYAVKVPNEDDDEVRTSVFTRLVRSRLDAIRREREDLMSILHDIEDDDNAPSHR